MKNKRLSARLLPLALPVTGSFLGHAGAADVNAVTNNGDWMAAATWADNAVPTAANHYFVPNGIAIDGDARTENQASSTRTFAGAALTIQNGGTLYLDSVHNASYPTWTYTIPALTLEDGSSLHVRGGAGSNFTLTNGFTVAANATAAIRHSAGSYDQRFTLGAINGPSTATIQIIASQLSSLGGVNNKDNYANVANSSYAGNWFLDTTATVADRNVRLRADAANALGTGTVTVARKAILENNAAGGFDSLSGITLQNDSSQVKFNGRDWTKASGVLTLTDGIASVGTAHLNIAALSQAGGSINLTIGGSKDGKLITSGNADFSNGVIALGYGGNPAGKTFDLVTYGGSLITPPVVETGDIGRLSATVGNGTGANGKVTVSFTGSAASLTWLGNESGFENDWDNNLAINWNNGGSADKFRNFDHVTFGNTTGSTTPNVFGTLLPGSVTFNHSTNDYTLGGNGSIGGVSPLTKSGAGTLTINAANSYSGGTTLNAGKLVIGNNAALGTGALTVNGGAITSDGSARTLSVPVTLAAPLAAGDATDTGSLTFNGVITDGAGSFPVSKQGPGTLTLAAANTYDGGTTLAAGKIRVGSNTSLGTGALTIGGGALTSNGTAARTLANPVTIGNSFTLGNATDTGAVNLSGPVTLAGNATISVESGTEMTFSGVIGGTGNLEYNRAATSPVARLNLNNTGNTFTGNLTVTSGRLRFASGVSSDGAFGNASNKIIFNGTPVDNFNNDQGAASLQQSTAGAGAIAATREVVINNGKEGTFHTWGSQTFTVNAPVTGGGRLRKEDAGTLLLAGNNSYSGGTWNTNGIIRVTHDNGLGTGDVTVGAVNNTLTARVDLEGVTVANNFVLNSLGLTGFFGPLTAAGGTLSTVNGNVTISSGVGNGGHLASNGVGSILRVNGQLIIQNGVIPNVRQGTVILAGGGSYPRLDQGQGTLQLGANDGISPTAQLRLAVSAAGTFDMNGYSQTLSQLNRATTHAATVTNSAGTPSVLTIDGTTDHDYNGTINNGTGGIGFVKKGTANVTLSGANTYQGDTAVEAGTLTLTSAWLADSSAVRITTGATLHLTHGASDTVNRLFLNGVQQPANTYHSGNSAFITGAGSLVVTTGPTGDAWSTWANANGVPADPALDSDFDGIPNGIEFVIGGDPSGPGSDSSHLLPTVTTDATYLNFTFRRTDEAAGMPPARQPYVQYGTALNGWTKAVDGTAGVIISEVNGTPDLVTVKIPRTLAASGKLFARLKVDIE